eukprot:1156123-Pelagomonas_calceolata.AAC.1
MKFLESLKLLVKEGAHLLWSCISESSIFQLPSFDRACAAKYGGASLKAVSTASRKVEELGLVGSSLSRSACT